MLYVNYKLKNAQVFNLKIDKNLINNNDFPN